MKASMETMLSWARFWPAILHAILAAHCVFAYTVYLTFPYENGVEYRVTNNLSHIGVLAPDGHAIVDYWVPLECDASVVQAFKRPPHIVVEVPCSDDPVYYTNSIVV